MLAIELLDFHDTPTTDYGHFLYWFIALSNSIGYKIQKIKENLSKYIYPINRKYKSQANDTFCALIGLGYTF